MKRTRVGTRKLNQDGLGQGSQVLVILVLVMSLVVPMRAMAEAEGTPQAAEAAPPVVVEAPTAVPTVPPAPVVVPTVLPAPPVVPPAPVVVVPTDPPAPVVQEPAPVVVVPTDAPAPTAVPPTVVPPTEVPPTAAPSPTAAPTPTEVVWVNTDSLSIVSPAALAPLAPGGSQQMVVRYRVTTPRSATTVHAELRGDVAGWSITSPALVDANPAPHAATWTEAATLSPGSAFDLAIVVSAPADVVADQRVELRLWSAATTAKGSERGVRKPKAATAALVVSAPEPAIEPRPTSEPVAEPTQEMDVAPSPTGESIAEPADPETEADGDQGPVLDVDEDDGDGSEAGGPAPDATPVVGDADEVGEQDQEPEVAEASPMASPVAVMEDDQAQDEDPDEGQSEASSVATILSASAIAIGSVNGNCTPDDVVDVDSKGQAGFSCNASTGPLTIVWDEAGITSGWKVHLDGNVFEAGSGKTNGVTIGKGQMPFDVVLQMPTGCSSGVGEGRFIFTAYDNKADPVFEETLIARCSPPVAALSVSVKPFTFDPLTWDGSGWGTTSGTARIEVHRETSGADGSYEVQVAVTETVHDLAPMVTTASLPVPVDGLLPVPGGGDPNGGAEVNIARVEPGFSGTGEVDVSFLLTPGNEVPYGTHTMTIQVTATSAP